MRCAVAKYEQILKEQAFRVYVTDSLRIIGENTAKYAGGGYIKERWNDIISKKPETRTGDEIISDIIRKLEGGDNHKPL